MPQQFEFDPSMQCHSHSYNPMAQPFYPSLNPGMVFADPPDSGASINTSAFVPQSDPTHSGASPTASEDGQTEDSTSARGKETASRRCKHKKLAQHNYRAACYYKEVYSRTAIELQKARQDLSALSQMARDMEALRQAQHEIMSGVTMIETSLVPAVLSAQRGTEQSVHRGSDQTVKSVPDRTEKEAANQLLLQDLLSVQSSLEGGNPQEGLEKVQDMISYCNRCATIRDHARILTESPGDWLIKKDDPSLQGSFDALASAELPPDDGDDHQMV